VKEVGRFYRSCKMDGTPAEHVIGVCLLKWDDGEGLGGYVIGVAQRCHYVLLSTRSSM
jgi:hypothetical protein